MIFVFSYLTALSDFVTGRIKNSYLISWIYIDLSVKNVCNVRVIIHKIAKTLIAKNVTSRR